jgi:hypothetical protein
LHIAGCYIFNIIKKGHALKKETGPIKILAEVKAERIKNIPLLVSIFTSQGPSPQK